MKHLLIGAAVVALAVGPLAAQGNGKGQSGGRSRAEQGPAMKGQAAKGAGRGNSARASGSMASAMEAAAPQRGNGKARANGNGAAKPNAGAKDMGERGRSVAARSAKPAPRAAPHGNGNGNGNGNARAANAANEVRPGVKVLRDGRRYYTRRGARQSFDFAAVRLGPIPGCPPGLARKNNGCLPPGQAKQRVYRPEWWGLTAIAGGPYAYDNGYLLRLGGDRVASYIPLLGGALSPGNIWPSSYAPVAVPEYYVDYYDLGPPGGYRYADNVFYRVDPATSAITSIAALLTGDYFRIGSPIPPGYDVYNVPYPYRSRYLDGPDARYRYSDGYIYQVDPATQLVTAAIDLLAG